ncbi:serpin family protein [Halomarina pelagica]|uniref:serpin family protein n=1 Tax=Halomarina pelagica TaxID=2961599 RepID=UPI0020C3783A|nr:serpin family protein [Halomarina sp. BND7]
MPTRRTLLALSGALVAGGLAGCLDRGPTPGAGSPTAPDVRANVPRASGDVPAGDFDALVAGNAAFACDLLAELRGEEPNANLFVSPYSVSVALAMTWAGARGETERQMAEALRFELDQNALHPAFNALDRALESGDAGDAGDDGGAGADATDDGGEGGTPFRLETANALWGLADYPYREPFLETLAAYYGAGMHTVDFVGDPEGARTRINDWVSARTGGKIPELFSEGSFDRWTRLVLTNAVYFRATWAEAFDPDVTADAPFTALGGSSSDVPTMRQSERFPYAEVDGVQVVELPYVGGEVGMVVVLPPAGAFEAFEGSLDGSRLRALFEALAEAEGTVALPRFTYRSSFSLPGTLRALGMPVAFDRRRADFGGMVDLEAAGENVYVDDVVHEAFVAVDEAGTEAAAATGVEMGATSAPMDPFEMTVDRPFYFAIRHRETDAVLFLGRVVDAAAAQ